MSLSWTDVKFSSESVTYDPTRQEERKRRGPDSKGFTEEHYSQTTGRRVGIFSSSSDRDYSWLVNMLRSEDFRSQVSAVRSWRISKDTVREFIQEVGECTFGILYQSKKMERDKVTTIKSRLQLETLCSILGKHNVIILIDDVEDSSDYEKSRILKTQHEAAQWAADLLLVSDLDKMMSLEMIKRKLRIQMQIQGSDSIISTNPVKHEQRKSSIIRRFSSFGRKPRDKEHYTSQGPEIKRHTVGIFSRSSDRDYSWLVAELRSEAFDHHVSSVQSYIISNSQNYQKFLDTISQCTFGILYHSKNRGRVNVTNVTDSLYDQELETLYMILGKKNVLVIIDDLEDSSNPRKTWILQEQHSIEEWAADLLLMSHNDKKDRRILRQKMNKLKNLLQGPDNRRSTVKYF
ncbi:uncharacterized protein LOC121008277 isoform X1 [Bufo bufo]|uniref:uncharacterized protein LOC121008277 isoform X1 n=1 Tax=Bufo bufo TaxID=8384 RepID=UPI001ABE1DF9|nr:uncharacterized protein LOC121008277 isoform X1 [Bufo bufo]